MKTLPSLKIRTWLLVGLIPSLLAATGWLGWSLYSDLYQAILKGFDLKLLAASTSTASFIRAEDHLKLMERPEIDGIAYDVHDDILYAHDVAHHSLLRIRAANGVLEPAEVNVERAGLRGLSFVSASRRLLTLEPRAGRLWWIDPATGDTSLFFDFRRPVAAFASDPSTGAIYLGAERLYRLDPKTRKVEPVSPPGFGEYHSLTYDSQGGVLWGVELQTRRLVSIDPARGRIGAAFDLDQESPVPRALTFDARRHTLLGCADAFLAIDRQTGTVEAAHFLPAFGREKGALYQYYVAPMQRIQEQLSLTYLYSEIITDRKSLIYGLDGTKGEMHSPLYSDDTLPDSDVAGMQELMTRGTPYISGVKDWPPWGLIKTGAAPIRDASGRTIAVVGADVDIGLIRAKSRQAMLSAFALGGLALLIAIAISLPLSLRLVQPLEKIQVAAIEAAAGRFACPLEVERPAELSALAQTFSLVRTSLRRNLEESHTLTQELLVSRHRRELVRILEARYTLLDAVDGHSNIAVFNPASTASGAIRRGPCRWLWIANSPDEPLAALRHRSDVALALQPWIDRSDDPAGGFSQEMRLWLGREVGAAVLVAESGGALELRVCGTLAAWAVRNEQLVEIDITQPSTESFARLILGSDGAYLRNAVASLIQAPAILRLPASAILAKLQPPPVAAAPAAPTVLVFAHVTLISSA